MGKQVTSSMQSQRELKRFRVALVSLLEGEPPEGLVGDLVDLEDTLRRAADLVRELGAHASRSRGERLAADLETLLSLDLPPIMRDTRTGLRAARKMLKTGRSKGHKLS